VDVGALDAEVNDPEVLAQRGGADLVVAELVVVAVVAVADVPSSPRWRCWSPIRARRRPPGG
jgi:hypothetical protein